MWKPDNYPSTGLSHSFLNWLSQSWTEVRKKKKKKSQSKSDFQTAGCKLWKKNAFILFLTCTQNQTHMYSVYFLLSACVGERMNMNACVCVCYTSPRGSGPHTLVRHGAGSDCCRSAGGPGSRCRSWCCRETRKSRESMLRFYGDTQSNISLRYFSHWWRSDGCWKNTTDYSERILTKGPQYDVMQLGAKLFITGNTKLIFINSESC